MHVKVLILGGSETEDTVACLIWLLVRTDSKMEHSKRGLQECWALSSTLQIWNQSLRDCCKVEKEITRVTKPPTGAHRQKGNCRDETGFLNIRQAGLEERMWLDLAWHWNGSHTLNSSPGIIPIILVIVISKFRDWTFNSKSRLENIIGNSQKLLLWLTILQNTMAS